MSESFTIELADCENVLLREIAEPACKQKGLAMTYAMAMMSSEKSMIDWGKVNRAIIARWSFSGLERIKTAAWKLVEQKRQEWLARQAATPIPESPAAVETR